MWEPGRKSQTGRHGLPCQADALELAGTAGVVEERRPVKQMPRMLGPIWSVRDFHRPQRVRSSAANSSASARSKPRDVYRVLVGDADG